MTLNPPYKTDAGGANVYDAADTLVCTTVIRRMPGSLIAQLLNEYARLATLRERLVDAVVVQEETVGEREIVAMRGFQAIEQQ
jgi:hypothetical protein